MNDIQGKQVINGREGELWIDGVKVAECTKCRASITFEANDIDISKHFMKDKKLDGASSDGELTLHKVTSMMTKKLDEYYRNRKMPSFTIISKLDDPDSLGAERVALYNCFINELILADWEVGKTGEESYKFTFTDYELLDTINNS